MISAIMTGVSVVKSFIFNKSGSSFFWVYMALTCVPLVYMGTVIMRKNWTIDNIQMVVQNSEDRMAAIVVTNKELTAYADSAMKQIEALHTEVAVMTVIKNDIDDRYMEIDKKYKYLSRVSKNSRDALIAPSLLIVLKEMQKSSSGSRGTSE